VLLRLAALTATWLLLAAQPAGWAASPAEVPAEVPVADLLASLSQAPSAGLMAVMPSAMELPLAARLAPGDLAYPLDQPALQIDPWGWRYSESRGAWRMHTGVDFAVPTGTAVLASLPGVVALAGEVSGYGLTVVLDHGQGLQTLYAHLQQIDVPLGQTLAQGEQLGRVGMTGRTSGPHLHFELRSRGSQSVAHDPIPYLPPLLPPPALTAVRP